MGVTKKAADAYTLFKKGKKIKGYVQLVTQSVDEDTRSGALLKLGLKATLDLAGKVLGTSLTSHLIADNHNSAVLPQRQMLPQSKCPCTASRYPV